jgi:hypothetical protein
MTDTINDAMNALAAFLLRNMQPLPLDKLPRGAVSERAALAIAVALPLLGGLGLSAATRREITGWYRTLRKPSWTPPVRIKSCSLKRPPRAADPHALSPPPKKTTELALRPRLDDALRVNGLRLLPRL